MNSIAFNLQLPSDLYKELIAYIPNLAIKSNDFIVEAIKLKLQNEKKQLQKLLIEGYKSVKDEELQLTNDFETVDYENI